MFVVLIVLIIKSIKSKIKIGICGFLDSVNDNGVLRQ